MFYVGEKVYVKPTTKTNERWAHKSVRIESIDIRHSPALCTVKRADSPVLGAFYETELESCYQHDMRLLNEYRKIQKEAPPCQHEK